MNRVGWMALALALAVTSGLAGCGGPEERKAKYRARAQEFFEQGNYAKARVALRNVLKIDPKDADAYFLYGQVEEKEKNWRNAVAGYQQAVELDPNHEPALIKLGKYYLEARALDKVTETAERVLAKHPAHVGARALKIAAAAVAGHLDESAGEAERLFAEAPDHVDAALLLASLRTAGGRPDEAAALLERALIHHPDHLELLDALALTQIKRHRPEDAERVLNRIVAIEPAVLAHRLRLAALYDQQGRYEQAESILRDAVRLDPDADDRRLALAEYLAKRRGPAEAQTALEEAIRTLPHAPRLRFALGTLFEHTQRAGQARAVYETILSDFRGKPEALEGKVKLAELDWLEGQISAAETRLKEVLEDNPRSAGGLLLRGRIALQQGRGAEAIQDFRSVLKDQPEAADVHVLLARAYLTTGDAALARESLEQAVRLRPTDLDPQVLLVSLDAAAGKFKEAEARLAPLLARNPGNLLLLGLQFQLQGQEQDWTRMADTLEALRSAGADQMKADLAEGRIAAVRKDWAKAEAAYRRAMVGRPEAPEPLIALIQLYVGRGELPKAHTLLKTVMAEHPAHPYAAGLLGELLLLKGETAAAMPFFQTATSVNPRWAAPWIHRARHAYAQQRMEEGDALLRQGIEANPESEQLRIMLATSLDARNRVDEAITQYEAILTRNPRSLIAANNLAATLADRKGDPESLKRALALSRDFERRAPNPYFLDTLGWVHLKLGNPHEALRLVQEAQRKAPDHPVVNYHLGVIYAKTGARSEARTHLTQALAAQGPFPWAEEAKALLARLDG
jgi:tetratricopeptide (TPR) repeat protein